ncbi:hypothetical protein BH09MYX1_BH09MYX1_55860 [soil metagenome]
MIAGPSTVCAIRAGALFCWGANIEGNLGDGTTTSRATPQRVVLSAPVRAAHVGLSYTCALLDGGSAWCWGTLNRDNGTSVMDAHPSPVSSTSSAQWLSDGTGGFACVAQASRSRLCWGEAAGYYGLPDANPDTSLAARDVPGARDARQISGGDSFACQIRPTGNVACAGLNRSGQLGDGTLTDRGTYSDVVGLPNACTQVGAAGNGSACALCSGRVHCWGNNRDGQLGDGTAENRSTPIEVDGLSGTTAIAVGRRRVCALSANGDLMCWGSNDHGGIGDGTTTQRRTPTLVQSLPSASEVAVGDHFTCANTVDGIYCWGNNDLGEMGDGTFGGDRLLPGKVAIP